MYLHRADITITISKASHAIITRWRRIAIFRWLAAVHMNNNNCNALIAIRNNFFDFSPTEDGEEKLIFIFGILLDHG